MAGNSIEALCLQTLPEVPRLVTMPDGHQIIAIELDTGTTIIALPGIMAPKDALPARIKGKLIDPRGYYRVGIFSGPIPKETSGSDIEAFNERVREIAESGRPVLTEKLSRKITQLIHDEKAYAHSMIPHS